MNAGYSFTGDDSSLRTNIDEVGEDLYEFLVQWFTIFDQYQTNDFYLFESLESPTPVSRANRFLAQIYIFTLENTVFAGIFHPTFCVS